MGGLTCTVGLVHLLLVAGAQNRDVVNLLNSEARTAASQIQSFIDNTVAALSWIDDIDQPGTAADYGAIREAAYRILRRTPSIVAITFFDRQGCARIVISRIQPDLQSGCEALADGAPPDVFSATRDSGTFFGKVFTPDGSEPHMYVGVSSRGRDTGALLAEINLKVIHESVAKIRVGRSGIAFVVDGEGQLIAHPDESLVLRNSRLPENFTFVSSKNLLNSTEDFSGQRVAAAEQAIRGPAWRVVVEQPLVEALAPVYAALWTTGALVAAAIVSSLLAGYVVAKRLSRPLSLLRDGAERIEHGDLSTQLKIATGDEIEEVADGFNRMARALADSHAHLEAKVEDRTHALRETTLTVQRQAARLAELNTELAASLHDAERRKADAERANAAKSRFLAVASHDLRQPMHAVSLLVGLLSEKIRHSEVSNIVRKVQGSVDAMGELFNSLLDISKLDAGALRVSIEDFCIIDLLERTRRTFEPLAEEKGICLTVHESFVIVRSDEALLERIIQNLTSNAIRYTSKGCVELLCDPVDGVARIRVNDTGIGIAEEFHSRIFDEFFQIATPAQDRRPGLGLGLSIVKRCAELLGHRLSLQSGPCGSQFEIDVPLIGIKQQVAPCEGRAREISPRLASAFVMVIDDDPDSRFAAEIAYRQWGCHVLAADCGEAAVNALQDHLRNPDLIVSDMHLRSGLMGTDAIELVRTHAEVVIPAIILSGESASLDNPTAPRQPCIVLQKPVGSERLKDVSERLLAEVETGAETARSDL